jgi:predicted esterase
MSRQYIRAVLATVVVMGCAAIFSAAALSRPRARPDLRILSGSAHVAAIDSTSGDRLVVLGHFTVANAGTATATRFRGWVEFTVGVHTSVIRRYSAGPLMRGHRVTFPATAGVPRHLLRVNWTIKACVVLGTSRAATPAGDGCRRLGSYDLASTHTGSTTPTPTPTTTTVATTPTMTTPVMATTTSAATTTTSTPVTSTPPDPVSDTPNQWFFEPDGLGYYENQTNRVTEAQASAGDAGGFFTTGYWAVVPPSYDQTNQTPEALLVWMHGCGGSAEADSFYLTNFTSDRPYIVISLNGPEGEGDGPSCWDTGDQADVQQVLTDVASAETHFNIDPRRVIIAGYSSGGDLAYQTIFNHADTFAGILAINTDPVRDNTFNNDIDSAIATAAWKFPIVHVMHQSDTTYPPGPVQQNLAALANAGFPVTSYDPPGDHYDADAPDGCDDNTPATCTSGTYYDIAKYLTSSIATDGWEAPAP